MTTLDEISLREFISTIGFNIYFRVDVLVRKQNALENEMSAIHNKLISHDKDAQALLAKKTPLQDSIITSLKKLEDSWKELSEAAELRSEKLKKSYRLHKYLDNVKKAEAWSVQLRSKMTSYQQPRTSSEARLRLEQHGERKAEIDGRQEELKLLHEDGQRLIAEQPEHKPEVQRAHKRVQNSEHQLLQTWDGEKSALQKTLDWLLWCDQASLIEQWLAEKENFLRTKALGEDSDDVQVCRLLYIEPYRKFQMLIKTHDAFEETVANQSGKIDKLKADAEILINNDNEFKSDIASRLDEILTRYQEMLDSARYRHRVLTESKKYHEFMGSCGELIMWITAKVQVFILIKRFYSLV